MALVLERQLGELFTPDVQSIQTRDSVALLPNAGAGLPGGAPAGDPHPLLRQPALAAGTPSAPGWEEAGQGVVQFCVQCTLILLRVGRLGSAPCYQACVCAHLQGGSRNAHDWAFFVRMESAGKGVRWPTCCTAESQGEAAGWVAAVWRFKPRKPHLPNEQAACCCVHAAEEEARFIERVVIHLHPTFRPSTLNLTQPPFAVRCGLGGGWHAQSFV